MVTDAVLDKSKPLLDYLNKIVQDEEGNQAVVWRPWTGTLVRDKEPSYGQSGGMGNEDNSLGRSFHYENIKYGEPEFRQMAGDGEFNKEQKLLILGEALPEGTEKLECKKCSEHNRITMEDSTCEQ